MHDNYLDGKNLAKIRINDLKKSLKNHKPCLAVILVGINAASQIYVSNKKRACANVNIKTHTFELPESVTELALLDLITTLNNDNQVHGILLQLPLPQHLNSPKIIASINPLKDVDGFHPENIGRLAQAKPRLRPCTPLGIINILNFYKINLKGLKAVVIGASNIVGRPMALELLNAGATVTICHSATKNLAQEVYQATLLIVAIGKKNIVLNEWLHKNHIIIDVGIHRGDDNKVSGDIDFENAKKIVKWITPVPGGVGPMTVATLLENTYDAYKLQKKLTNANYTHCGI